ncbi:phosphoglucosamine mutase [filamentous cyanobacterium CCP5]|nr:phosphoglucosamine mutase [filamentous cyanobacterium CCP5]
MKSPKGKSLSNFRIQSLNSFWDPLTLPGSKLFGTDGIRNRVGPFLNSRLAYHVGFWFGQVLQSQSAQSGPVILGQDSRNSGHMLVAGLAAGLSKAGIDVWQVGLCPTPAVAYLTRHSEAIGGIMVSASHNPPEDNGIKVFGADGMKLEAKLQDQIENSIRGQQGEISTAADPNMSGQSIWRSELINQYVASLLTPLADVDLHGLRVVLDLAWGAAVYTAPTVFTALGAEVISLHEQPDGDRINVHCGSTHLDALAQAVQLHRADLGFAFDGDADRVIAVDSHGRSVDGDYILYLWGQHLQAMNQLPGKNLVSTVMANLGFERAWVNLGGTLTRTPVGDQHVHTEMMIQGIVLGGEQSGHILCHRFSLSGDGVLTALHLAALVQRSGQTLAELRDQSFRPYPQLLKNVRIEDSIRRVNWQSCEALQNSVAKAIEAMGNQGRVLVRASGTEPFLRIMVEAECPSLVSYWAEELSQTAQRYLVEQPQTLLSV